MRFIIIHLNVSLLLHMQFFLVMLCTFLFACPAYAFCPSFVIRPSASTGTTKNTNKHLLYPSICTGKIGHDDRQGFLQRNMEIYSGFGVANSDENNDFSGTPQRTSSLQQNSTLSLAEKQNISGSSAASTTSLFSVYKAPNISITEQNLQSQTFEEYEKNKLDIQLLLLDNYDSYTYNIYSYLCTMCKHEPIVVTNNKFESWDDLVQSFNGTCRKNIDGIVISPGPGRPECKDDIGICLEAIAKNPDLPILGVCLGHQALGYYYNASVILAPNGPVHGLTSKVWHDSSIKDTSSSTTTAIHSKRHSTTNKDNTVQYTKKKLDLFQGIPQYFDAVRYHSLVVEFPKDKNLLDALHIEPIAWCDNDHEIFRQEKVSGFQSKSEICMGLRHKRYPHYGVQFHPESVGTGEMGYKMLKNFCQFCFDRRSSSDYIVPKHTIRRIDKCYENGTDIESSIYDDDKSVGKLDTIKYQVFMHKIKDDFDSLPSPETVFEKLYASKNTSFWLDSSTGRKSADIDNDLYTSTNNDDSCPIISNSRFSIMGSNDGPLSKKIEYWGFDHPIEKRGVYVHEKEEESWRSIRVDTDLISFLNDELATREIGKNISLVALKGGKVQVESTSTSSIPFDFSGGYVGYLGYEMRHDTERLVRKETLGDCQKIPEANPYIPTAAFIFADRSLLYDHWRGEWYVIGVAENSPAIENEFLDLDADCSRHFKKVLRWMKNISKTIQSMKDDDSITSSHFNETKLTEQNVSVEFKLDRSKAQYVQDIARCHDEIRNGESYELCLTNQFKTTLNFEDRQIQSSSPFGLYKILRKRNPSPFASFMNFNGEGEIEGNVSICCSSPERFLSVTTTGKLSPTLQQSHGWEFAPPFVSRNRDKTTFIVESKPIKGTAKRTVNENDGVSMEMKIARDLQLADELQSSVKNRAENLMIVDLLRNDLSRVCEPGSVHVPKLMAIESFTTVHQMVSTIRGRLDATKSSLDVLSASFPGGSMTGAPKLRSVDILHDMEGRGRGPYSGCLGYISLNGSMDMNIIIRSAVLTPGKECSGKECSWDIQIGAGGAITALSESEDEFDEMHLKAKAIKEAIIQWHSDNASL